MQCAFCDRWSHPKCGDISKALVDILLTQPGIVNWYCSSCAEVSKKVRKEIQNITLKQEEILKEVQGNKAQLTVHKGRLDEHEKRLDGLDRNKIIDDSNEIMLMELQEREARKNNLVIHQIPEPPSTLTRGGDKRQHDINKVLEIFEFLDCSINKDGIKFIYRPGETGTSDKPRPVILNLRDPGARQYILANTRLLANSKFSLISIIPDLTIKQRKCEENLRKEADKRNRGMEKEESTNWEWVLVGERGQRRLIKRKKLIPTDGATSWRGTAGPMQGPSRPEREALRPSARSPGRQNAGRERITSPQRDRRHFFPASQNLEQAEITRVVETEEVEYVSRVILEESEDESEGGVMTGVESRTKKRPRGEGSISPPQGDGKRKPTQAL